MHQLNENLLSGDLSKLVHHIFEIDSYKSKMGADHDVVVLSFSVDSEEASKDLVNFIERGYDFVLDSDNTPGDLDDGTYKVFVEIARNRRISEQIMDILYGLSRLADIDEFRFRYYKSFHSEPATLDTLKANVPGTEDEYNNRINQQYMNNFSNFFNRSYLESINMVEDDLIFQKKYQEPLRLKMVDFGKRKDIYESTVGRIMLEHRDISESTFLSRYIGGDYDISKIGNNFIFTNNGYSLSVQMV